MQIGSRLLERCGPYGVADGAGESVGCSHGTPKLLEGWNPDAILGGTAGWNPDGAIVIVSPWVFTRVSDAIEGTGLGMDSDLFDRSPSVGLSSCLE